MTMTPSNENLSHATMGRGIAELLIDAMRLVRILRAEYRAATELLGHSLEIIADQNREIDRLRLDRDRLIDERRERRAA